ncbi:MAG: hypothetical protein KDA80_05255 [Planctomycetaceae bacterium]|nr:hypothetical protein [Planctomycetaceae bacterium]
MTSFPPCSRVGWMTLAWGLLMIGYSSIGFAQPFASQRLDLGVTLCTNDHSALSDELLEDIFRRTEEVFTVLLGTHVQVVRETTPNLNDWLKDHSLTELTAEQCVQFGIDRHDKELLLEIRYDRGRYQLAVCEYDHRLDILGALSRDASPQRTLIPDLSAQLALTCWSPVGTVVGQQGNEFRVTFPHLARLVQSQEWSGLRPGAILQLGVELDPGTPQRQLDIRSDQFLVIKSVETDAIIAELALPESGGNSWFRYLGNSRARYLVRRLTSHRAPINVHVTLADSQLPREGCFVYVSDTPPRPPEQLGEWIGSTSPGGQLRTPPVVNDLQYVTVAYEDLTETRVVVPGVTPTPVPFTFQYRGAQTACQLQVDRLKYELADTSTVLNLRLTDIEKADQALDVDKAETAAKGAQQSRDAIVSIRDRAAELEQDRDLCDSRARLELQQLVQKADELLGKYRGAGNSVATIQIKLLQGDIDAAWREHRWADARRLLSEYLNLKQQLGEADGPAQARYDEVTAALAVTDQDHLDARQTLEQSVGIQDFQELTTRWPEIRDALSELVQHKDHLWLRVIYGEFQTWNTLLANERRRQDALRQSQTLTIEQKEDLLDEMKATDQFTEEFRAIVGAVANVIREADARVQGEN